MLLWKTARENVLRHFKNESKGRGQIVQGQEVPQTCLSCTACTGKQATPKVTIRGICKFNIKGNIVVTQF